MMILHLLRISAVSLFLTHGLRAAEPVGEPWKLHIIDDTSDGADGVKLADINKDGLTDIVTGWEEGGIVRIYQHPGHNKASLPWPKMDVGRINDVEDALLVDIDQDGRHEVITSSEGTTQQVGLWRFSNGKWVGDNFPQLAKRQWMFARAMDIDGKNGIDIVLGAKNKKAEIGWLQAPQNPFHIAQWRWHSLSKAGWIMSIFLRDIDGDGDKDIIYSDRRGKNAGIWWLERTDNVENPWPKHLIWKGDKEIMSFGLGDMDGDGFKDLTVALAQKRQVLWLRRTGSEAQWNPILIDILGNVGDIRDAVPGDLDGDGDMDLAISTWNSQGKHGLIWFENLGDPPNGTWRSRSLSGTDQGIKYDHLELLDLDGDGDLDLLTCEEHESHGGLGVIWYENPHQ